MLGRDPSLRRPTPSIHRLSETITVGSVEEGAMLMGHPVLLFSNLDVAWLVDEIYVRLKKSASLADTVVIINPPRMVPAIYEIFSC